MTFNSMRRGTVLAAAGALVLSGLVLPGAAQAAGTPAIRWGGPCGYDKTLQCGKFQVPLDYSKPTGKKITLHVERHRATGEQKTGSIFVNPGGPGGPGQGFSGAVAELLGSEVAAKYDIVSFDPRGIGKSAPLQCFDNDKAAEANWSHAVGVPISKGEMSDVLDASQGQANACAANAMELIQEMSTLNVARDLDQMRQAVGDDKLNYAGYSYGTMVGAVYANAFPDKVGRLLLDGPVDPANRANNRVENKRARAEGFEIALNGFLDACDDAGAKKCSFAAGDDTAAAKFAKMRETLREGPVEVEPGKQVTISTLVGGVSGPLYARSELSALADGLEDLYQQMFAGEEQRTLSTAGSKLLEKRTIDPRLDQVPGTHRTTGAAGDAYSYNGNDTFFAVNCADTRGLPRSRAAYPAIATSYEQTAPTFGRSEAFSEAACGWWPRVDDRYAGPWNKPTAPILVVGQTHDPATPYSMAKNMAAELGNAQLLTIDGFGHCSQDSKCAEKAISTYMLTGKLPKPGTTCNQDVGPLD